MSLISLASPKLGILRKAFPLILPLPDYCWPVWSSAAACHLYLDRAMCNASFLCDGSILGDLGNRRDVKTICMIFKIPCNNFHPIHHSLLGRYVPTRNTRLVSSLHSLSLQLIRCHTSQFQRCSLPNIVHLCILLKEDTFLANDIQSFKSNKNKTLRGNCCHFLHICYHGLKLIAVK